VKTPVLSPTFRWQSFLVLLILIYLSINTLIFAAQPTAFSSWAKTAKLAGAPIAVGMSAAEINTMLDKLVQEGVTVVEADSDLSNYQSEAQFELELALMRQVADASHKRGLRVVWYFPALEVITLNGKTATDTMAKTHPDWLQIGLNGKPNVFYGGGGQVFWVESNAESAWMSPSSTGYRDYFFKKVQQIVATGIDGLWADVPIYSDFGPTKWSDVNPEAIARFKQDTGLSQPSSENWNDKTWKRWIQWRHQELARFLKDLTQSARSINPEFAIFAETLPTDYNGGTVYGLDGSYLKNIEGLTEVWEVDTMSNNVGMRNAHHDDWISFISALKYTRGATGDKPSWVFSYGKQPDDAQQVMTQALMTGNNPYELKVPEMASSVGSEFRSRLFKWSKVYSPYLFNATSNAKTAILYSSPSRDYVDKFSGLGMFATTEANGDDLWWAGSENESVYQRDYLAEHRGILKILVNEHIPFNVLVSPNATELNAYQTILLPNVEAIADTEAALLKDFVKQGGKLIITGTNPTGLNHYGEVRSNYALADLLGFNKGETLPMEKVHSFGAGQTHYYSKRLGKQYLVQKDNNARSRIATLIRNNSAINISTDASDSVYLESSQLNDYIILQFGNFIGMKGKFSIEATHFKVTYTVPSGKKVSSVNITHPDTMDTAQTALKFTQSGDKISFNVTMQQYVMVLIAFEGAVPPKNNHIPVAGDDELSTAKTTPLTFSPQVLLANDGDLDGDKLTISQLNLLSVSGSTLTLKDGNYTYTPASNFSGVDTLMYRISDGQGGTDSALLDIYVGSATVRYYPNKVVSLNAKPYGDPLNHFHAIDDKTYDIAALILNGKKVTDWYASTLIKETISEVTKIKLWHMGQYSINSVTQTIYLYNFKSAAWELVDTASVANEGGYPFAMTITKNIAAYISPQQQIRLRIKGEDSSLGFNSWSEQLYWEVSTAPSDIPDGGGSNGGGNSGNPPPDEDDKSVISISNSVSSNLLSMDANLSDWQHLQSFGKDGDDIQQKKPEGDWLEAWMAHDEKNLYIAYQNDGAINQEKWWLWAIYLDTDNDKNTGFKIHKNMGADYFFNGGSFWRYTGTGGDWAWDVVSAKTQHKVQGDIAELSIPRHLIKMGSTLRVLFQADNLVTQDNKETSIIDRYPNQADRYFSYHLDSNTQPIAYHDAASVNKNSTVDILLNAKDPNGKTLSYGITMQPKQGKLTGMGANRGYTPNTDFIGKDSFRFKVNNGQQDSEEAHVEITVTAGVPNNSGVNITLDGDASDWATIQAFSADAQEINAPNARIDWIKAQLAHNKDTLYLAYQNHYPIDTTKWWLWETYLDTDDNPKTGYQLSTKLGAEYVLQGNTLYRYTGTGEDWQWSPVKSLKHGIAGKFAEVAIPRKLINNPAKLRIAFFGNNASYVDTPKQYDNEAIDFYPEQKIGYFQYHLQ